MIEAVLRVEADGAVRLRVSFDLPAFAINERPMEAGHEPMLALLNATDDVLRRYLADARLRLAHHLQLVADGRSVPLEVVAFPTLAEVRRLDNRDNRPFVRLPDPLRRGGDREAPARHGGRQARLPAGAGRPRAHDGGARPGGGWDARRERAERAGRGLPGVPVRAVVPVALHVAGVLESVTTDLARARAGGAGRLAACRAPRTLLLVPLALLLSLAVVARAAPPNAVDNPTAARVNAAVQKAKDYLYAQQKPDGTWEDVAAPTLPGGDKDDFAGGNTSAGQWGGQTSLALYALLAAGESPREPRLAKTVEFVKTAKITGTYAAGVRMLALSYLPMDPAVKAAVGDEAQLLLRSVKTQKDASGHYDYNVLLRDSPTTYSHSRSQYGTLGMWAAERMGFDALPAYWQLVDAGWRRNQRAAGGWGYKATGSDDYTRETLGMTVAGVASLFITDDMLDRANARACNGNLVDPNIEGGLKWIAEHFEDFDPEKDYARDWKYPTL